MLMMVRGNKEFGLTNDLQCMLFYVFVCVYLFLSISLFAFLIVACPVPVLLASALSDPSIPVGD